MSLYYINDADEMELEGVAIAIEEAGFTVGAVRIRQAMEEIQRLKEALSCIAGMHNLDARVYEDRASGNEAARIAQISLMPNIK